jgi:hypothetical protein
MLILQKSIPFLPIKKTIQFYEHKDKEEKEILVLKFYKFSIVSFYHLMPVSLA